MKNTTLCYLEKNEQYLMLYRNKKKNDPNAGKWIGVGGKFEEGESPDECLCREVFEETGLKLTRWHFKGIVTFVSDTWPTEYMHLFTADCFEGDIHPCNEGDLRWIPKSQIAQLPVWEGDRLFLQLLAQNEPFFLLKLEYQGDRLERALLNGREVFL